MNEVEISLFPIPGSVSLPFSKIPLHVFEPRYRKLIMDSVDAGRRVGIAHTIKKISESKIDPKSSLEERLNQNQGTYLSHQIFSAGFVKIIDTLPDGRIMVEILTDSRYQIISEKQEIPYKIVVCKTYNDDSQINDESEVKLRLDIDQILLNLVNDQDESLTTYLKSKEWMDLTIEEFSFKIYSIIGFEPDVLQKVLELRSSLSRITFLKDILTRGLLQ